MYIQYFDGGDAGCSTRTISWSQSSPTFCAGESKATSSIIVLPSVSISVRPAASSRASPVAAGGISSSTTHSRWLPTASRPAMRSRSVSPAGTAAAAVAICAGGTSS
jgi:hypothetical protein